ncbi:hypothetical protein RFI_12022 [Reticulomyxa filosa]|uniref:SAM domain-containing protein n=1 Tax=Reticulomyxa filosa TaxID=46433 RepID=X6NFM7_RETFI|nr:hypothetical protein RFI_12022 [Reticulomyxa filosa]|eukprot:ETO25125.1 hypothetical protein RFI_12022 [Reticulomyxa filosa]
MTTLQSAALQWLSNGEMNNKDNNSTSKPKSDLTEEKQITSTGIWDHVSLQSLQTMYGSLDLLLKQHDEVRTQIGLLRATCLTYISKKQDDWENWNFDEVVDWISAIENGRFSKYDIQLRKIMEEISFRGEDMKTLKFDRLSSFGIQDYDDADTLMNCIEILVKSDQN